MLYKQFLLFSQIYIDAGHVSENDLLQGETTKCEAIVDMKMIFYSHANKTHFHKESFALSLVLKVEVLGTRKWPTTPKY